MARHYETEIIEVVLKANGGAKIVVGKINYSRKDYPHKNVTSITTHTYDSELRYSHLIETFNTNEKLHNAAKKQIISLSLRRGVKEKFV